MTMATLLLALASVAQAKVYLSTAEALSLAFQGCEVKEQTVYLSDEQRQATAALAQAPVESSLVRQYIGLCDGQIAGTAYFDTHRVRTLPETLMVVIDAQGRISRIEVLSFTEPEEYLPPAGFYGQFAGRALEETLSFKRASLRRVTGATLSCSATMDAARRSLALHQIIGSRVSGGGL